MVVNIFLLDSPITAQTLIRNAKTSVYARHHEFVGNDQCVTPGLQAELGPGMTHLPAK